MRHRAGIATLGLALALPLSTASTQQTVATTSAAPPAGPAVNDVAPDFTLTGADKYGLLKTPVKLSDFRGRTVVLAFFFQARTKG
ncbi:MAG TPA: hypothetical protein VJ825_10970 [Gemmatimonadaceae bacterium]|nr:hypothetical protein [Gemmatimonadaceae bacterium]